ncbi:pyridoxamine 5'-phosphate oxidase family protein [Streptomyces virginiae]|uniref:pyridoxamine 5'-phosphate oxidase family protein n=1 Tax=Streptomyces virginiae TaxID=1961 RepID=UPI00365403C2
MDHETARRPDHRPAPDPARSTEQLDRSEALRLLGTVSLGRIVFTHQALPAIRPMSHIVDGEDVLVQLDEGASHASLVAMPGEPGIVLAYEADATPVAGKKGRLPDELPCGPAPPVCSPSARTWQALP